MVEVRITTVRSALSRGSGTGWDAYIDRFHADHPGITEAVLRRARRDDFDAYAWLAAAVPAEARVLDLCCGSGPLFTDLPGRSWIGVDRSAAELADACQAGAGPLLQADATRIPLRDSTIDVVVCSMGLMVAVPTPLILDEVARILRPGGLLVATIPSGGPLTAAGRAVLAGLVAALGRAPGYPAGHDMARVTSILPQHGLRLLADDHVTFDYPLRNADHADQLLNSLYLPGLAEHRYRLAGTYLRTLARHGKTMPIPLRRITAQRPPAPPEGHSEFAGKD